MIRANQAVILVAGEGKRLRPLTDSRPKCFASVAGKLILENALAALACSGCSYVRIVTGHFAELVRDIITPRYLGMEIEFVTNRDYATTNSMFSLAMGLEGVTSSTWVLEGDVFFEPTILGLSASPDIAWFVDSATRNIDGAYVESNETGRACSLQIIRDLQQLKPNQSKSIGILKLSAEGVRQLQEWLREGLDAGQQNLYYDLIIGPRMAQNHVNVVDVAGYKWFEIDTREDLEQAGMLFA